MYTNAGMALASSLRTHRYTHTDHSLNKLIYLFQLFDKCIIPQTLGNHFRRIISFMMWKDYPECAEQSLYLETVQEVRHSQGLGKEGLIDRKGIFFVAAPLVGFFFSFLPLQEWSQRAELLTLCFSSAFHSAMGISRSALFQNKEQSVHWQMKGREGRCSGLPAKGSCDALPEGGGSGKGSSAQLPPGLHEHITPKHIIPGRLVQTGHLQRCWVLAQSLWGLSLHPAPGQGPASASPGAAEGPEGSAENYRAGTMALLMALNWRCCPHSMWLCWSWHLCRDMAERGK